MSMNAATRASALATMAAIPVPKRATPNTVSSPNWGIMEPGHRSSPRLRKASQLVTAAMHSEKQTIFETKGLYQITKNISNVCTTIHIIALPRPSNTVVAAKRRILLTISQMPKYLAQPI
jgi:hypothetical protein